MKGKLVALLLVVSLIVISGCSNETAKNEESQENSNSTEEKTEPEKSTNSIEPKFVNVMIEKVDSSNFYVVTTADGEELSYAYYVSKDGEIIDKFEYKRDAHFSYTVKEPGSYKVTVYIKDRNGNTAKSYSTEVQMEM
ncbi:triple tyrosine motif-containing protein [Mesobacillus maritimus]|uniref:triple tyrosine motif-containing protein n=1 Tax=Mesobacillus maritimus TaxID=1643336 RepID=UPI00384F3EE0